MKQKEFYRTHHGLHVFENVFVDGCPYCEQKSVIMTTALLLGIDPEEAVSDAKIARNLGGLRNYEIPS